jgi:hypothetical protein
MHLARAMDGALVVAVWFASALLVFGVALARGVAAALPPWLLVAMVVLGPAGVLLLVLWLRGRRGVTRPAAP